MNMILCQITAISLVVYGIVNSALYYKLREEVKKHKKACTKHDCEKNNG